MATIRCQLECGHALEWGDTAETPGADLPWTGRIAYCAVCETDTEIVEIVECGRETMTALGERAYARVAGDPALWGYEDIIFYEWPDAREHLEWVVDAPVHAIIAWASRIREDEEADREC